MRVTSCQTLDAGSATCTRYGRAGLARGELSTACARCPARPSPDLPLVQLVRIPAAIAVLMPHIGAAARVEVTVCACA